MINKIITKPALEDHIKYKCKRTVFSSCFIDKENSEYIFDKLINTDFNKFGHKYKIVSKIANIINKTVEKNSIAVNGIDTIKICFESIILI